MISRFPRFGVVCMGAGFILLGIFSLLLAAMLMRDEWRFLTNGAQALGRVSGNEMHTEARPGGTRAVYDLLYTFQDAGHMTRTGKDSVRAELWARPSASRRHLRRPWHLPVSQPEIRNPLSEIPKTNPKSQNA
jgi:hypothetical protein